MERSGSLVLHFARLYTFPHKGWYLLGMVALAITSFVTLKIPLLAKSIVNSVGTGDPTRLQNLALLMVGLGILQILIRTLSRIFIFWPGRKGEAEIKSDLFRKVNTLPQIFFDRYGMGDLISRLSNDVGHVRVLFGFGGLMLLNMVFLFAFVVVQMALVHKQLAFFCLLPISLMIVLSRVLMPKFHQYSKANQEAVGRLTNRVTESFINVHNIQSNVAVEAFVARTEEENEEVFRSNMKLVTMQMILFPLISGLSGLSQVVVLFYGGYEVIQGHLTVGDILVFNVYIAYLAFPLSAIGIVLAIYQRAKTALERLWEVQQAESEAGTEKGSGENLVTLRSLTFSFPDRDPVLKDVSLSLEAGKKIGLFGPIGSGKTVLLDLIARLYDPPPGTLFVRGKDVLEWEPNQLRETVGFAEQTVHLFSDTVKNNLLFGVSHCTDAELEEAARGAQVLDEILGFEKGWETQIGEKGVRLSGGQKQRLSLARLFLRKPKVLLLDDVLSAVDQVTELKLVRYMEGLSQAMIVASHRVGVLRLCDEILILKNGEVVDRGNFPELEKRHPELREARGHHGE